MANRLISSIYTRGDESSAHYKSHKSKSWSYVLKNAKHVGKGKRVNIWLHQYEMYGTGSPASDPLMEMFK